MQAEQAQAEHLLLVDEVADVRAREAPARGAGAVLVERRAVAGEARVAEVQSAVPRERATRAAVRVGRTQSNMSTPRANTREDALRVADAHEVARPVGGQQRRRPGDGRTSPRAPRRPRARRSRCRRSRARRSPRRAAAQLHVDAALHDPEEELARRAPARRAGGRPMPSSAAPRHDPRAATSPGGHSSRHIAMSRAERRLDRAGQLRREARLARRRRPSGRSRRRRRPRAACRGARRPGSRRSR